MRGYRAGWRRASSGVGGALMLLLVLSWPASGGAPGIYANPDCGFRISNPLGWEAAAGRNGLVLIDGQNPVSAVFFDAIEPIPAGEGSADALALAAAGEYCLNCLADTLVWMDRMTEGRTTVSYTISDYADKSLGHIIPYYHLAFFIVMPAPPPRTSGRAGWTRADLNFYVPKENFHALEPAIMDMARSFSVTEPKKACWTK